MKVRFVKPEAADPERDRGVKIPYAPAKRNLARWRWYLILLVVTSPFLFFVAKFIYASAVIQAPGFIAQEQLTVRAPTQGYVAEIFVKPLDPVRQGDPVARLANDALATHAAQLRAELKELQGVAVEEKRQPRATAAAAPLDTMDFAGELDSARQQQQQLGQRLQQMQELQARGAATEAEVNGARSQYEQAKSKLDELYRTMAIQTQAPPQQPGSIAPALEVQTRILAIRTELANLDGQLEGMLVRAPKDGRIVDLPVIKGDQMALGSKLASLAPTGGAMHIDAYIPPKHAEYAIPGARAVVIFPDGRRRRAVVTDVPQIAAEVPRGQNAMMGTAEMGVLVRMQFADRGIAAPQPLTDGLPIKVQFDNGWNVNHDSPFLVQLRHYFASLMDRLTQRA